MPSRKLLDIVEEELERTIQIAASHGDNDLAYELSVQLKEYRQFYRVDSCE